MAFYQQKAWLKAARLQSAAWPVKGAASCYERSSHLPTNVARIGLRIKIGAIGLIYRALAAAVRRVAGDAV